MFAAPGAPHASRIIPGVSCMEGMFERGRLACARFESVLRAGAPGDMKAGIYWAPHDRASSLPRKSVGCRVLQGAGRAGVRRGRVSVGTVRSSPMPPEDEKTCACCGRRITWRKKWARSWDTIRYCSDACRKRRVRDVDAALEEAILTLLSGRAADASICPSEAARRVGGEDVEDAWRALMEPARAAARRLVARGAIEITQHGRAVDPSTAKGPIRLRRTRSPSS